MLDFKQIFEPPSFLDKIDAFVLGFGGCFLIVLFFIAINKRKLGTGLAILISIMLYFCAIGTGIGLTGTFSDRGGAFIAGFWAPTVYGLILTILIAVFYKPPKEEISNIDHLINH